MMISSPGTFEEEGEGSYPKRGEKTAYLFVGIVCVMMAVYSSSSGRGRSARLKGRLSVLTIWTSSILFWPLIWKSVIDNEEDMVSLVWPIVILGIDVMGIRTNSIRDTASKRSLISMDANAICSITFALSGIMGGGGMLRDNNLFLYSMAGCAAFILPSPFHNSDIADNLLMEALQKTVLAYSIGFLLGGVIKNKLLYQGLQVGQSEKGGLKG